MIAFLGLYVLERHLLQIGLDHSQREVAPGDFSLEAVHPNVPLFKHNIARVFSDLVSGRGGWKGLAPGCGFAELSAQVLQCLFDGV